MPWDTRHETNSLKPVLLLEYEVTQFRDASGVMHFSQLPIYLSWIAVSICGLHGSIDVPRGFALSLTILDHIFRPRCKRG